MPFGKKSQEPVPKKHMVKTHAGIGNHKVFLRSHAAVRNNATGFQRAPIIQPSSGGSGTPPM